MSDLVRELEALIIQWRHNAQGCGIQGSHARGTWRSCANDLASVLALANRAEAAPTNTVSSTPLPKPSGYIRIKNGQYQIRAGGEEPHDRGNGHHGPWVHMFDTPTLRAYGDARAAEGRVSMRAASLWPSRWTVELHPNKANAFRIIHRDGRRTDYTGPKDADLKLMWELILDTLEESHV